MQLTPRLHEPCSLQHSTAPLPRASTSGKALTRPAFPVTGLKPAAELQAAATEARQIASEAYVFKGSFAPVLKAGSAQAIQPPANQRKDEVPTAIAAHAGKLEWPHLGSSSESPNQWTKHINKLKQTFSGKTPQVTVPWTSGDHD